MQESQQQADIAHQRLAFLSAADKILAQSLDYRETLKNIAQLSVPILADWCIIDLLSDEGILTRLTAVHSDPDKAQLMLEINLKYPMAVNSPHGFYRVIQTLESEYIPMVDEDILTCHVVNDEKRDIIRGMNLCSYMAFPLIVRNKVLGVVSFSTAESGRIYTLDEVDMVQDLIVRIALALENALLHEETLKANEQLEQRVASAHARVDLCQSGITARDCTARGYAENTAQQRRTLPPYL